MPETEGWVGNGRLRQGQARRGKAANRASEGLLSGGPSFLFFIYRRLEEKQSGAVHAPVHTRKSADYSVPKKTRAPTTDMHRWGLVHAMTMRQVSFSPLLCKRTEQCYSMRRPRASHRTVWGRCELLQARARAQGASRSCWLVMQAVILGPPPLLSRDEHSVCYSTAPFVCWTTAAY